MSDQELDRLEREVEIARARLVGDMARLRSPDGASIKQRAVSRATNAKDALLGKAKDAARERAENVVDTIRAKVAANPGAALAIAAGIGWRLYRHPPVATVLVGAGLMGLMRADPEHPAAGAGAAARAVDFAGSARSRVADWRSGDSSGDGQGWAADTREQAGNLIATAKERAGELAQSAREQAVDARHTAAEALRRAGRRADHWTESGRRKAAHLVPDMEPRDGFLLGAAALALAAAVGVAARRRSAEELAAPAVVRARPNTQTVRPYRARFESVKGSKRRNPPVRRAEIARQSDGDSRLDG